ncbi:centromere-associated protein E [Gracilaria domingensis]|nr:centromere-associated protein E [Gracilaria domingensis]
MTQHGVGLARTGLAVRENCTVEAAERRFDDGGANVHVDVVVGGVRGEDGVIHKSGVLPLTGRAFPGDGIGLHGPGGAGAGGLLAFVEGANPDSNHNAVGHRGQRRLKQGAESETSSKQQKWPRSGAAATKRAGRRRRDATEARSRTQGLKRTQRSGARTHTRGGGEWDVVNSDGVGRDGTRRRCGGCAGVGSGGGRCAGGVRAAYARWGLVGAAQAARARARGANACVHAAADAPRWLQLPRRGAGCWRRAVRNVARRALAAWPAMRGAETQAPRICARFEFEMRVAAPRRHARACPPPRLLMPPRAW